MAPSEKFRKPLGLRRQDTTQRRDHIQLEVAVRTSNWIAAECAAREILAVRKKDPFALKALGVSVLQQGRVVDAIPELKAALEVNRNDPELANNLGIAYLLTGEWAQSIEYFRKSLATRPKDYATWQNLGRAYVRLRRPREAVEALVEAIELYPGDYHDAVLLLAAALKEGGQIEQSFEAYKELKNNGINTNDVLSALIFISLELCEWDSIAEWMSEFRSNVVTGRNGSSDPMSSLSFPDTNWAEHHLIAKHYATLSLPRHLIANFSSSDTALIKGNSGRLRIGYFSGDFRTHPVGFLIPQLLELHDRSRFEVFGYSVGIDDASAIRQRIISAFDHFTDLGQLACHSAVQRIREDKIDVLVNLQGWTNDYASALFAERAAPVQMSWIGYAGTMGHEAIADYLIGDAIATPLDCAPYFSETLAQLNCCYLPMDSTGEPPKRISRERAGLIGDEFVFCSFNNRYKINPPLFDLWCEIIRQCPDSILWLSGAKTTADKNLQNEFEKRGLAASRIRFAPRVGTVAEHRERISAADLALDPAPYNSHSSGLDTLWAGVPMISMIGNTFAGRVGASLLTHANLTELIVKTPEEYVNLAVSLYKNRDQLQQYRQRLESERNSASLWNTEALTRSVEKIFEISYRDRVNGIRKAICLT